MILKVFSNLDGPVILRGQGREGVSNGSSKTLQLSTACSGLFTGCPLDLKQHVLPAAPMW